MPNLVRVDVIELLGQFDHTVKFPADWDFCILYGPNGVGKTKLLELIHSTLTQKFHSLAKIPFKSAVFLFEGNVRLTVHKSVEQDDIDEDSDPSGKPEYLKFEYPELTLEIPGHKPVVWNTSRGSRRGMSEHLHMLRRAVSADPSLPIRELSSGRWVDSRSGRILSIREAVERGLELGLMSSRGSTKLPTKEVIDFFDRISVNLIETQRLMISEPRRDERGRAVGDREEPSYTVLELAVSLARSLREAMAENSRISQRLDSSFARRVLEEASGALPMPVVTEEAIRTRYIEQNELREELAQIALLDASSEMLLPPRELEDWEIIFLRTYLDDTDKKLDSFRGLLNRVRLFRDIVNSRFQFKKMFIDREDGFYFETTTGQIIKANDLSSGEQHEVVMTYKLLFQTAPGSLVLVDEPEISLHVAWQKKFISDIRRISEVAGLRFVIATHSPQVISQWWDRAIKLSASKRADA
ncbi:AAA family ATPase [Lentzea sp. NPDC042327]|uniref:AAA family ATPase n=1 Tax=Lentzea sp. NPDC042327 TaxID=3154801 RepID=UPI0034093181